MLQTVRAEKVDKKIGVIGLVLMFPTWVVVCKLSKKVHFLQFCAELSKKCESVEAIYIYASESTHYTLSENAMISRSLTTVHEILAIKISKKDANSAEIPQKLFDFKHSYHWNSKS